MRVKLPRKPTTGPRYLKGTTCLIVTNGMKGYHDITVHRPHLANCKCIIIKEPVYPATWYIVKVIGDGDGEVKVRASNLTALSSPRNGGAHTHAGAAAAVEPPVPAVEAGVIAVPAPGTAAAGNRAADSKGGLAAQTDIAEDDGYEALGDPFESFVYSNALDPDASATADLLHVAKVDILPGLHRVLHGGGDAGPAVEAAGGSCDAEFTILSPAALSSVGRHLDAGRYRTFKAFVSDVRRLFAFAYQMPLSADDEWRIQVAEGWFDSALICAGHRSRWRPPAVPQLPPSRWPGASSGLLATVGLGGADGAEELDKIAAALEAECGAATPTLVPPPSSP